MSHVPKAPRYIRYRACGRAQPSPRLHPDPRAGASHFPAANVRYVPRLRAPLECRWRIDPMTGALTAFWLDPSANTRAVAPVEQEPIDARRWFTQSPRAARGYSAPRLAA
ncbi:MAG: hypothetical protein ACREDA_12445 [Methylocella sp.]